MIYYDFSKFRPIITKQPFVALFTRVMDFAENPLELFLLLSGVPGRENRGGWLLLAGFRRGGTPAARCPRWMS